jgi:hypothetical protein
VDAIDVRRLFGAREVVGVVRTKSVLHVRVGRGGHCMRENWRVDDKNGPKELVSRPVAFLGGEGGAETHTTSPRNVSFGESEDRV